MGVPTWTGPCLPLIWQGEMGPGARVIWVGKRASCDLPELGMLGGLPLSPARAALVCKKKKLQALWPNTPSKSAGTLVLGKRSLTL